MTHQHPNQAGPPSEGPLRFIADPTIRAEAEDQGFAHGGVEHVMPHADGCGLTVEYGDNTRATWRWGEGVK